MEIKRDKYLNDLIIRKKNGLIKVVTGLRRSGKSYLVFHLFRQHLLESGVPESHIVEMAFDLRENRLYWDPDVFLKYVRSKMTEKGDYYILLDEVQLLGDFEEVLNSLLHIENADIYVTGSNSRFLSKDVITEFRGRGDEVRIHPLTFKEYCPAYEGDVYHAYADYIVYGGLPLILSMKTEEQKINYLETLFEETYIKDIVDRNKIGKRQELGDLINALASGIGSLSSVGRIEATFHSKGEPVIAKNTLRQYIEYLKDAYLISEASRYDVKGRRYIGSPLKYYFEDVGLRNARLGFRDTEEPHLMENVIYNELIARGYKVDTGIVPVREISGDHSLRKQFEIDFVANMGSKRYYIQSAFRIPDKAKEDQEKASLSRVPDSFKKIVIVKDVTNVTRDERGIVTMGLYDFLLMENSLDL